MEQLKAIAVPFLTLTAAVIVGTLAVDAIKKKMAK